MYHRWKPFVESYLIAPKKVTWGDLPIGTIADYHGLKFTVTDYPKNSLAYVKDNLGRDGNIPCHEPAFNPIYPGMKTPIYVHNDQALKDPNVKSCDICFTMIKPEANNCHVCGAQC